MIKPTTTTTPAGNDVDAMLSALSDRFCGQFDLTASQIAEHRSHVEPELHAACVTCDVPKDTCDTCDLTDVTCSNQHDISCITCDEGDVCTKADGSCNIMGDIPCGKDDK